MPRVITKRKNRAGKRRVCGHCQNEIMAGDQYRQWSFRYGGTHYRCMRPECRPRASELTQSIMGEIYDAVETAQSSLSGAETVQDIVGLVEEVAQAAESVKEQYEEAAEPFQGGGQNGERAEELEGWVDELQSFQPEEPEEDASEEEQQDKLEEARTEAEELIGGCPL